MKNREKIWLSITGNDYKECKSKVEEIKKREFEEVCLFFPYLPLEERKKIYQEIEKTKIKKVPLVHISNDFGKSELQFLFERYKTRYFTIHESDFDVLSKWDGFLQYLFLEMNSDNIVAENVKVEEIGGFCIDLAHYQKEKDRGSIDYDYVYNRRKDKGLFKCNHLSGYSFKEKDDLHYIENESDFDYLKKLPKFIFSETIAIEVNNSIEEQIKFREYIENLFLDFQDKN